MATLSTKPRERSTEPLPQRVERRSVGPVPQKIRDTAGPEGTKIAAAQELPTAPSRLPKESWLPMITKTIAKLHDWLSGPPMTTQDRIRRDITEHSDWMRYGPTRSA